MRTPCTFVLAVIAAACAEPAAPVASPIARVPSAAPPAGGAPHASASVLVAPVVEASFGVFRERARVVDDELRRPIEHGDGRCGYFPLRVFGMTVVPATSDEAWVLGSCGLRLRHRDGRFTSYVPDPKVVTCGAPPSYRAAFARSSSEAYLLAYHNCFNPMQTQWAKRPLERFDGTAWRAVGSATEQGELAGSATELWRLVDDFPADIELGPERIDRWDGKRWRPLREERGFDDRGEAGWVERGLEVYDHIGAYDGGLWVVGRRIHIPPPHGGLFAWHHDGKSWSEAALADSTVLTLSVAPDGTAWAAGMSLWRGTPSGWAEVEPQPPAGVVSIWAKSASDVWLVIRGQGSDARVVRFDGQRYAPVEVSGELTIFQEVPTILGSGDNVWIHDSNHILQLVAPGAPAPARERLVLDGKGALSAELVAAGEAL